MPQYNAIQIDLSNVENDELQKGEQVPVSVLSLAGVQIVVLLRLRRKAAGKKKKN
jgi:hypothetical protein